MKASIMLRQEVLTRTQIIKTPSILKIMENLVHINHLNKTKLQLNQELDHALEIIRNYELLIIELQNEKDLILKNLTHNLSNPLQILSMTIESLQHSPDKNISAALERMKRSTDKMTEIILEIRKLRSAKKDLHQKSIQIV